MDCELDYNDVVRKSSSKSALKTIKSKRNARTIMDDKGTKEMGFISPSEYIKQMTVKPENFLRTSANTSKFKSPVFTPSPKIIVFQRFNLDSVYSCNLNIRNVSQVPHQLKLAMSENFSFNVTFKGTNLNTRLAPGMIHTYEVEFRPDEYRDYSYEIEFKTDLGSFLVPVIAVGPKPLLSFPDQIDMETTGLKVPKTKPILLHNVGEDFTGFSIYCDNPCFTVSADKGTVHAGEALQVKVTFLPTKIGNSHGKIFLRYESGDTVQTMVLGHAIECKVWMRQTEIRFDNTYLDLARKASVEVFNDSEYLLRYQWLRHETEEEDRELKERYKEQIDLSKDLPDDILPSAQELVTKRMHADKCKLIDNDDLHYSNDHFILFPMKGEVWPNKSATISITFEPKTVGDLTSMAYLEIEGTRDRISLSLFGKALGPALELNLMSLDVQELYLCSKYNYEVVCKNSGPIPGTLTFLPKSAEFGSLITVEPSETKLQIGNIKSVKLAFCSNRTGSFVERVDFRIKESSEILSFVMKGTVICPLVRVDNEKINFYQSSIGFTVQKQLSLRNLSHTPIEYSIRVPSDGDEVPVNHEDYARAYKKPSISESPREFQIHPWNGVLKPDRCLHVQISYTPNIPRDNEITELHVKMCKSPNAQPMIVLMNLDAKSGVFTVEPSEISVRFCYVNFPYCRKINVKNCSNAEGYFYILPQEVSDESPVLYTLSTNQGYLKPGKSKEINLSLIVKEQGKQTFSLSILGLGYKVPVQCCDVSCIGEGPVVSTEPTKLDWGEVPVLRKHTLTLELINDSPIPAEYKASMSKSSTVFEVEPSSCELEANESITLDVTAFIKDTGKYSDRLLINVANSSTVNIVNLTAIGVGTCIIFDPDIFPTYDLGVVFSRQDLSFDIKVTNEGNRHHSILFSITDKPKLSKKSLIEKDAGASTIFRFQPSMIELAAGAEEIIQCKTRRNLNEFVTEDWFIFATIEGKRELLGVSTVTATFTEPNIIFDKDVLNFRVDMGVDYELFEFENEVMITNQTNRDMYGHFSIDTPFAMLSECNCSIDYREINLVNLEPICLRVVLLFDKCNVVEIPRKYCGYINIYYDDHKHVDKILCRAEVNFPHLVFLPNELDLYCPTGSCVEKDVKVINDSPLTVFFNIEWIKESFKYESLSPPSEEASEEMNSISNSALSLQPKSVIGCSDSLADLPSFLRDSDMDYCEDAARCEPKEIDIIDRFLRIKPRNGRIEPHEESSVAFTFHGLENVKISVQAKCEIKRGCPVIINVNATSDTVRCTVDNSVLDYGLQVYCESAVAKLRVTNQCRIPLNWHVELYTDLLRVIDGPEILQPLSDGLITVERLATPPGYFNEKLFLEITHLEPFIVHLNWLSTIPQVHLDVPRNVDAFKNHPPEFGYGGVQLLTVDFMQKNNHVDYDCLSVSDDTKAKPSEQVEEFTEFELMRLLDNDWDVVGTDEIVPSVLDIDMAFERYIVKDFMTKNRDLFTSEVDVKSCCLPPLVVPGYVVDLSYVSMDDMKQLTLPIKNFGYEKAKVKMKKELAKRKTQKSCWEVDLAKNLEICQCESSFLNVAFSPKKDFFGNRETEVSYKLQLEVKRGLVIPVILKATAVYPYLSLSTRILNFDQVFIGECRQMGFRIKNEGAVDCSWSIYIDNVQTKNSKHSENPFYLQYSKDKFVPGQSGIVEVYFNPFKHGYQKRELIIEISNGQANDTIKLVGYGLRHKLKISKPLIKFRPMVPLVKSIEEDLIIENVNPCPLEVYWQHLDDFSESNKILHTLKHYYGADKILIPHRKVGDPLPQEFMEFFDELAMQMLTDENYEQFFEDTVRDVTKDSGSQEQLLELRSAVLRGEIDKPSKAKVDQYDLEILLHAYIDNIQAYISFVDRIKNPFAKMLEKVDKMSLTPSGSVSQNKRESNNKVVVIFYGAPFTEYQETACRCAKALNLPLLNLNNLILEAVALGETSGAKKLAQQIDARYKDLVLRLGKLKRGSDVFTVLNRLPKSQDFEKMDALSMYETKLELLEFIANFSEPGDKGKTGLVPGVTVDVVSDILKARLNQTKFNSGYVLQSLKNIFLNSNAVVMRILLDLSSKDDSHLLVTFHNSYELYVKRILNLDRVKAEEEEKRFHQIEAMSETEFLGLSEEDKFFFDHYDVVDKNELALNTEEKSVIENSEKIMKQMEDYEVNLKDILATIVEWETGKPAVKKVPTSAKGKRPVVEPEIKFPEKVFFWLVQSEDPWDRIIYDSIILQISHMVPPFADKSDKDFELLQMFMPAQTYSLLKEHDTQPISELRSKIFTIIPQDDELEKPSLGSSQTSVPEIPARWILEPGEYRKFKVEFKPLEEGRYKTEFLLSLVDNPEATFKIEVEGLSDVPRIDMTPEVIFDKVKNAKLSDAHEPCFFMDTQTYDFGCLLVLHRSRRKHQKRTQFRFHNISILPATVFLSLTHDKHDYFEIDPPVLDIDPGETEIVNVTAQTPELGSTTDNLVLTIKNNDQPEVIQLHSRGTELLVEVEPQFINLGRLLLFSTEKQWITLKNRSAVVVYWRLRCKESDPRVRFTPSNGKLKQKGNSSIEINYYASRISAVETKQVNLEYFLSDKDTYPFSTQVITMTVETYEIIYDLQTGDEMIELGNIPVGSSISKTIVLRNLGPYEFKFMIEFNESEALKKVRDTNAMAMIKQDFKLAPKEGLVLPKKQATINITLVPSFEYTLKSLPLLNVLVIEPYKDTGVTNECALEISAVTFFTRCSIEPFPSLDFGILALNSTKTMQLRIENIGQFPFQYSIVNVSTLQSKVGAVKKPELERTSKMTKARKLSTSGKNLSTNWGPFTLEKTSGELEPGEVDVIRVQCCSVAIGSFEEKLFVIVPDTIPDSEESRQILLVADVCVANIDLKNVSEIFSESYVVDTFSDFRCSEVSEHTVFSKLTSCLHFCQVCLNGKHSGGITLRNTSSIDGEVTLKLSDDSDCFKVSTERLMIPSMSQLTFEVTFSTAELGTFTGKLEVAVDLPPDMEPQTLVVNLEGKSHIPQIRIVEPASETSPTIDFGMILNHEEREKFLKLQNVGQVMAEVTLDIADNLKGFYSIRVESDLPCGCSNAKIESTYITSPIAPNEIAVVVVKYHPKKIEKSKSDLIIQVENNPYESFHVSLIGESFAKSVVLENLKIITPVVSNANSERSSRESNVTRKKKSLKQSTTSTNSFGSTLNLLNQVSLKYELNYDKCFLNKMYKINFRILNKTPDRYFKFEWSPHQNVVFVPTEGHLGPTYLKEVIATFFATEPIELTRVPLDCILNEITLSEPIIEPLWDSRQTKVSWKEKNPSSNEFEEEEDCVCEDDTFVKKVIHNTLEPECKVIPGTTNTIQILVSAVADYTQFECDVDEITFENTLMFQTREYEFTLTNTGTVNLDYTWDLASDEQYPTRLRRSTQGSSETDLGSNTYLRRRTEIIKEFRSISDADSHKRPQTGWIARPSADDSDSEESEISDLFSSTAGLTDRSTDSWIESDNWPFSIRPEHGVIEPGQSGVFTTKFAPIDVFEYRAHFKCKIENLLPNRSPPMILVYAKSYLPYCHFEIENSDYLEANRRDNRLPLPAKFKIADPEARSKIRVVEFILMGVGICHTRYIPMLNPTTDEYAYRWTKLSTNEVVEEIPALRCNPETGISGKGKRIKFAFSAIPENVGLYESFWQFEIKRYALKTQFLIVFHVVEPSVCCQSPTLKLEPTCIGEKRCGSFVVRNKEACSLDFRILPETLYSDSSSQTICVCPMCGVLGPNQHQTFNVEYEPTIVGEHNFNIKCKVEKLRKPVSVDVIAQVFEVQPKVIYIDSENQKTDIREKCDNIIDVGQIILNEVTRIEFKIINVGQTDFFYSWEFNEDHEKAFSFKTSSREDKVNKNSHNYVQFELIASDNMEIRGYPLTLKVRNGPTYRIKLNASAKKSSLEFSFSVHDFGACYIQTEARVLHSVDLLITNHQKVPCLVECQHEDTPSLQVDKHELANVIPKNATIKVPIQFQPLEERQYEELISFTSCHFIKNITIKAEGISYKVRLKNPCDAVLDVGTVPVGRYVNRKVTIANYGDSRVTLKIVLIDLVIKDTRHSEEAKVDESSTVSSASIEPIDDFIQISPSSTKILKPNCELDVGIKFKAVRRVKMLKAKIGVQVDASMFPLTTLKGRCSSANFFLNRTYISFGTVYLECSAEEKLVLINDGDVGSKFSWDTMKSQFSVTPTSGFCKANTEITFTCVFKPSLKASRPQTELVLKLSEFKNLSLIVAGNSNPLPDPSEVIDFTAEFGLLKRKEIQITNDSDQIWNLKPFILGDCFDTPDTLSVFPKEKKSVIVTYEPLRKTLDHPNVAKMIIPLPNGRPPIVFSLIGQCTQVDVHKKVTRTVPAYKKFVETFTVRNNSDSIRTFDCWIVDNNNPNATPTISQVTVPAKKPKPFDVVFKFKNEGTYSYKFIFDDHQENYESRDVEFMVVGPEVQKTIELVTFVRSPVFYSLKFVNTSLWASTFQATVDNDEIVISGLPTYLQSRAFKTVTLEYLPLKACEKTEMLIVENDEDDKLFYELRLTAKPAVPERTTHVEAILGDHTTFTLRLKNYTRQRCQFTLTSDETSFTCPEKLDVPAGEEATVDVQFKPKSLEDSHCEITAYSEMAGEYVFPIVGKCKMPPPQGPFVVTSKTPVAIKFVNVFEEDKDFEFSVDSHWFIIKETNATIKAKESFTIQVSLENEDLLMIDYPKVGSEFKTGKLAVTCRDEVLAEVKWIYYLKGIFSR